MPHEEMKLMEARDTSSAEHAASAPFDASPAGEHDGGPAQGVQFAQLVTGLLAVHPGDVETAIQTALRRLLDLFELDTCALFLQSGESQPLHLTRHQCRPGGRPPAAEMSAATDASIFSRLQGDSGVYVGSLDEAASEADRDTLERWGVRTLVVFPLTIDGTTAGAVCFGANNPATATAGRLEGLRLVAHAFGSALGRERASAVLQSSEERFQTIADQAPVLIWIRGSDMRPTWFNRHWLDFVGHTLDEEIRDGGTGNIHPED